MKPYRMKFLIYIPIFGVFVFVFWKWKPWNSFDFSICIFITGQSSVFSFPSKYEYMNATGNNVRITIMLIFKISKMSKKVNSSVGSIQQQIIDAKEDNMLKLHQRFYSIYHSSMGVNSTQTLACHVYVRVIR